MGETSERRTNWMKHASALRVLRLVLATLADERILVLPVKGVITAHWLYEDVALRTISDIDLRIRRRDYGKLLRIARAKGWNPNTENPALWQATLKVEGCDVDIECTLGPPGLCALSVDDVIGRAHTHVAPFGFSHLQPDVSDHSLILVLNAFKDGLRPMAWAREDLRRIARHDGFDAAVLVARARRAKVSSALWIVANWLARDHGAAEWLSVRELVGAEAPNRGVVRRYGWVQRWGWPQKAALFATACASDDALGCAKGFALTAAAIVRRRALVTLGRARG